ncbi:membrane protein [Enterococcus florum]|uniref:Membrane protein n=1 Tax=Enterococcus florum TaxID=2480627 RepID=A0A4P5P8W7_9ENTE|nr:GlsB/YeaQ/YmgE family stress response membrane protein [Enterococcus florum]GCF93986.1 membrane protein [Enterococcus florum]
MSWLWTLIVGAVIGMIGGSLAGGKKNGCVFNVIAGLVGSSVGQALFGYWGPQVAGMALIPSILGAVIVVAVVSFFFNKS